MYSEDHCQLFNMQIGKCKYNAYFIPNIYGKSAVDIKRVFRSSGQHSIEKFWLRQIFSDMREEREIGRS